MWLGPSVNRVCYVNTDRFVAQSSSGISLGGRICAVLGVGGVCIGSLSWLQ